MNPPIIRTANGKRLTIRERVPVNRHTAEELKFASSAGSRRNSRGFINDPAT